MADADRALDYELPACFYLGKRYELDGRRRLEDKVLYDAKDLTTHAMCVGMTGSGKTGLCLALLEEAAIDGIPAICIDPKGDLGNLLLTFPALAASDFEPWIDPDEAARQGVEIRQLAERTASQWREGLQAWDQPPERIGRFRESVEIAIYTPGSNAGIPLTVLKSFAAPPPSVIEDGEVFRERVAGTASGLLTLLGNQADPLTSREHILLSNILDRAWRAGTDLDLPSLIRGIQNPPLDKVGVFDLESFFPAAERMKLAMSLNNLLASPSFAGWLEGQPLDIKSLLYTSQGKPRLSIISIAHLNDTERMFFVTILLNELLCWVRGQPGTSSLRALFYMDEVYGYFPPSAKPPSKPPMLVLLKQARAYGLGVMLATQNPADLDYKGLANIGTWFLGRLQTQRDKDRVLDGLEGAALQTGSRFDKASMSQMLAALGSRVFLMNNVHDDGPIVFQSRWALSYLRGPLSRQQIQTLMDPCRHQWLGGGSAAAASAPAETRPPTATGTLSPPTLASGDRPLVPHGVTERFWLPSKLPAESARLIYRPALFAKAACRYVQAAAKLDEYYERGLLVLEVDPVPDQPWRAAGELPPESLELARSPEPDFEFQSPIGELLNDRSYRLWQSHLVDELYRHRPLRLFHSAALRRISRPGQSEQDVRIEWAHEIRELRDAEKAKLRQKYARLQQSLEAKLRTVDQRLQRQQAQLEKERWNTVLSVGSTIVGKLMGNKISSTRSTNVGRGATRMWEKGQHASATMEARVDLIRELEELDRECQQELQAIDSRYSPEELKLDPISLRCRKGDIRVDLLCLLWVPWQISHDAEASPLVGLPPADSLPNE